MTTPRNFPRFGGVKAKPRLSFARASPKGNARGGTVLTFTESQYWTSPAGARILQKLEGRGQDGKPASGAHSYVNGYNYRQVDYVERHYPGGGSGTTEYPPFSSGFIEGPVPNNYCTTKVYNSGTDTPGDSATYYYSYTCMSFFYDYVDNGNYQDATTGAAATGFDKVFAGGPLALPATSAVFYNVRIEPNTSYLITVPVGGSVTIEY